MEEKLIKYIFKSSLAIIMYAFDLFKYANYRETLEHIALCWSPKRLRIDFGHSDLLDDLRCLFRAQFGVSGPFCNVHGWPCWL